MAFSPESFHFMILYVMYENAMSILKLGAFPDYASRQYVTRLQHACHGCEQVPLWRGSLA